MMPVRAYIGLGSNLQQPLLQLQHALLELQQLPRTRLQASSSFYLSPPIGPTDQPDYINSVAAVDTELTALDLLVELQRLEQAQGRVRAVRWGPRTLDLDLLLYGDQEIRHSRLRVPHPGISQRPFVLLPLYELAPTLEINGLGKVSDLLAACDTTGVKRIADE